MKQLQDKAVAVDRDKIAKVFNEAWKHWSKTISEQEQLSDKRLSRWRDLWNTLEWEQLTEEMKNEDRKWADKVIKTTSQAIEDAFNKDVEEGKK